MPRASQILLVLFISGIASCSNPENKSAPEPVPPPPSAPSSSQAANSKTEPKEKSPEYMLAAIDEGGHVSEKDAKVIRIRYLLKSLSERTGETQYEIANATAQTTNYIRDTYGKTIKNLELMEKTNKLLSSKARSLMSGMTYRESAMVMAKALVE